tara:strand:+ start:362 stop:1054 length:693 start_codon:yes stop_codon:yes gene_type:complete
MNQLRNYIRQVLVEMAAPRPIDLDAVYYHGTPTKANAEDIMINGIKAPDLSSREGYLRPVEGKVYLTRDLAYAQIYALGGDLAGKNVPDSFKGYGQYGYVFVVDGKQLKDIQPDEDSVGELVYNEEIDWLDELAKDILKYEEYDDFGQDLGYRNLYDAIIGGEYDAWAAGGKILLDEMSDDQKLNLLDYGAHVAHTGNLIPKETWRIERNKTPELQKDGSNFFDLAERIK